MIYKYPGSFTERAALKRKFSEFFEVSIVNFHDTLLSLCLGYWTIDLVKFDQYLHGKFGEYEDSGLSMKEFITTRFGKEASDFLEELI